MSVIALYMHLCLFDYVLMEQDDANSQLGSAVPLVKKALDLEA